MKILLLALAVSMLSPATAAAGTVGFQRVMVPDSDNKPRDVGIWYPSDAAALPQSLGPYRQTVAIDGTITGRQLPLVVILRQDASDFDRQAFHREFNAAVVTFFKTKLPSP